MSKHRRLELEHFCLQYFEWKEEFLSLNFFPVCDFGESERTIISDTTSKNALRALELREKMEMAEKTAEIIDISKEIFIAVTLGKTYSYFEAKHCPFGRDLFYDRLRRFYFLLDKIRR